MRTRATLWGLVLACLCAGYLVQAASPLRLNTDAIEFLEIAASVSDGQGFLTNGKPSHYPPGYPLTLAALDHAGMAHSASLIGLNLAALGVGLACACFILSRSLGIGRDALFLLASMTLLSWVIVKHATLPISDVPYFGVSLASLALATRAAEARGRRKLVWLAGAAVLAAMAVSVRTIGVALAPALAIAAVDDPSFAWNRIRRGWATHRRTALLGLAGVVVVLAAGGVVLASTKYAHEMVRDWRGVGDLVRFRLEDWGDLLLNGSQAQLPGALQPLMMLAGLAFAGALAMGVRARRAVGPVDLYLGAYTAILLVWPYRDARFWVPVVPLLLGYAWVGFRDLATKRPAAARWIGAGYLAGYAAMGLLAIAYTTWLTFSGDRFADRYGGGIYRASYLGAFGVEADDAPPSTITGRADHSEERVDRVLRRFGPRRGWDSPGESRDYQSAGIDDAPSGQGRTRGAGRS